MRSDHPYRGMPDYQFWRKEPGIAAPRTFDPVVNPSFTVEPSDRIVTAGSCFAQHVARYLSMSGFNFLVTEPLPAAIDPKVAADYNYGLFSARYGNIYTARQLLQLLRRAWGDFTPLEGAWPHGNGENASVVDPFRPQIQSGGFYCERELALDRETHLAAVRAAFTEMNVFVFTLGLTECWYDKRDAAVYPIAPGVAGGHYEPEHHGFRNFTIEETVADMLASIAFIRSVNSRVKFIITVSPVPLNATAVDRHVFVSTTYSKAVLRVAAEQVCAATDNCDYFPSYEIITSPFARGAYYGPDCREVTAAGVEHVMSLFLKHYTNNDTSQPEPVLPPPTKVDIQAQTEAAMNVLCDEEAINNE